MSALGKTLLTISIGLLLGVLAIALLPFLVVFSLVEIAGISETSFLPLLLIKKLFKDDKLPKK